MSSKPFRVLGIQQVAIGGPDKQRLRSLEWMASRTCLPP